MNNSDNIVVFMTLNSLEKSLSSNDQNLLDVSSSIVFCPKMDKYEQINAKTIEFLAKTSTSGVELDVRKPQIEDFDSQKSYAAALYHYWNEVNEEAAKVLGMRIDLSNPILEEIIVKH